MNWILFALISSGYNWYEDIIPADKYRGVHIEDFSVSVVNRGDSVIITLLTDSGLYIYGNEHVWDTASSWSKWVFFKMDTLDDFYGKEPKSVTTFWYNDADTVLVISLWTPQDSARNDHIRCIWYNLVRNTFFWEQVQTINYRGPSSKFLCFTSYQESHVDGGNRPRGILCLWRGNRDTIKGETDPGGYNYWNQNLNLNYVWSYKSFPARGYGKQNGGKLFGDSRRFSINSQGNATITDWSGIIGHSDWLQTLYYNSSICICQFRTDLYLATEDKWKKVPDSSALYAVVPYTETSYYYLWGFGAKQVSSGKYMYFLSRYFTGGGSNELSVEFYDTIAFFYDTSTYWSVSWLKTPCTKLYMKADTFLVISPEYNYFNPTGREGRIRIFLGIPNNVSSPENALPAPNFSSETYDIMGRKQKDSEILFYRGKAYLNTPWLRKKIEEE